MKKRLSFLLVLALLLSGCGKNAQLPPQTLPTTQAVETTAPEETVEEITQETTIPETEPQPETFTLTFVGDCTLGSNAANYYAEVGFLKTIGTDYGYPFRNVLDWFSTDDGTFVNLEGPLTDEGYPVEKTHVFHGPTQYVQILTGSSIEGVTLANNHTRDYGETGYVSTVETLTQADLPFVERDSTMLVTLERGLTVGFYAAVYYHIDVEDMQTQLAALKEQADVVVFAPHWGIELTYTPTQEQKDIAKAAIEAGADIVWGSHPHVLQPIETYQDGIILYSMGNFCFGGNIAAEDMDTAIVQIQVIRDSDGNVTLGESNIIPCSLGSRENVNDFQPTPYPEGSQGYERVLKKLNGTFQGH